MFGFTTSELLFYGGIAGMGTTVTLGIVAVVIFHFTGKRLRTHLAAEFGKRKRR